MVAVESPAAAGMNLPSSRKDRALERRSSEDAEGDRRMMGSGRLPGAFGFMASDRLLGILEVPECDFFWIKGAASLRTCEKSYVKRSVCDEIHVLGRVDASIP